MHDTDGVRPYYLSYPEFRRRQVASSVRRSEVPVGHAISVPLPTNRLQSPGYASFASPTTRTPGEAVVQGAPDRWWVCDARSGHLLVYSKVDIFPFAGGADWDSVVLPRSILSLDELKCLIAEIEQGLDALGPVFFDKQIGDRKMRIKLVSDLKKFIPEPLADQYRMIAPDFFDWLATE